VLHYKQGTTADVELITQIFFDENHYVSLAIKYQLTNCQGAVEWSIKHSVSFLQHFIANIH
jgi:hypothetical protein